MWGSVWIVTSKNWWKKRLIKAFSSQNFSSCPAPIIIFFFILFYFTSSFSAVEFFSGAKNNFRNQDTRKKRNRTPLANNIKKGVAIDPTGTSTHSKWQERIYTRGDFNARKHLHLETSTLGKRQRIFMGETSMHVNIYIKRLKRSENDKNVLTWGRLQRK